MVDVLQLITGIDIPVEGLGITIHQPRIEEIAILGQDKYLIALQLFSFSPKNFKLTTEQVNTWMVLQEVLKQKIDGVKNVRQLILNFLQLFFIDKVQIGPRSLLVGSGESIRSIEPEQLDIIQTLIKDVGGYFLIAGQQGEEFKPINDRAAKIAEKMNKAREKLAKIKAAEGGSTSKSNNNIITTMIATIATKTANSLSQINQMTIYQLNKLFRSYLNWESFDLEVKSRLAGAKNDKTMVHWTQMDEPESSIGTI